MNARMVRVVRPALVVVLTAELATLVGVGAAAALRSGGEPVPARVVDSRCIDGRVPQGIDDGSPDGLLAYDTGRPC